MTVRNRSSDKPGGARKEVGRHNAQENKKHAPPKPIQFSTPEEVRLARRLGLPRHSSICSIYKKKASERPIDVDDVVSVDCIVASLRDPITQQPIRNPVCLDNEPEIIIYDGNSLLDFINAYRDTYRLNQGSSIPGSSISSSMRYPPVLVSERNIVILDDLWVSIREYEKSHNGTGPEKVRLDSEGLSCFTEAKNTVFNIDLTESAPKPPQPKPPQPKPSQPEPSQPKPPQPKPSQPEPSQPKPPQPKPSQPKAKPKGKASHSPVHILKRTREPSRATIIHIDDVDLASPARAPKRTREPSTNTVHTNNADPAPPVRASKRARESPKEASTTTTTTTTITTTITTTTRADDAKPSRRGKGNAEKEDPSLFQSGIKPRNGFYLLPDDLEEEEWDWDEDAGEEEEEEEEEWHWNWNEKDEECTEEEEEEEEEEEDEE